MENIHLDLFLKAAAKNEPTSKETMEAIAKALIAMQEGASFNAAFGIKKKPGRKQVKSIWEKDIYEAKPYLDAIDHYIDVSTLYRTHG